MLAVQSGLERQKTFTYLILCIVTFTRNLSGAKQPG